MNLSLYFGRVGLYMVLGEIRVKGRIGMGCSILSKFAISYEGVSVRGWCHLQKRV